MNACKHFLQTPCPHHPLRPSIGTCAACPKYAASTKPWSEVRVKGKALPAKFEPVPHDQWPAWATAASLLRKPDHIGVGDSIKYLTGEAGERYKRLRKWLGSKWPAVFAKSCKCEARRREWNARYPYSG